MSISITGLSGSGLDTTALVESLMEVERIPLQGLQSKKSNLQSQQSVFRQLNTKLNTLQFAMADFNLSTAFNINKGTVANANIASVSTQANAAAGNYNIEVKNLASYEVQTSITYDGTKSDLAGMTFTIGLGTEQKSITLSENSDFTDKQILEDLVRQINLNSNEYGATAALIDTDGTGENLKLSLTATKASEVSQIPFSIGNDISSPLTKQVQVGEGTTFETVPVYGKKATILVNGVEVTRDNNNFDNIISGVSITASQVGTTQITVGKDTDTIAANVQKFVNAYNDVIDFINTNIAKPTEEGVINPLQGDSVLKQLKTDLYNMVTGGVKLGAPTADTPDTPTGPAYFMESIGLAIDANKSQASQFTGKISFNAETFKKNLTENAHIVEGLFSSVASQGVEKIKKGYTDIVSGMVTNKITGFDNQIKMNDERVEAMTRSLTMKEARLKLQFNTMETMLLSLNSQSSWLKSQFDSLTKIKE